LIKEQVEQYKNRKYPQIRTYHYQRDKKKEIYYIFKECLNRATSKKSLENILDSE
jgi:hypothetical protein